MTKYKFKTLYLSLYICCNLIDYLKSVKMKKTKSLKEFRIAEKQNQLSEKISS
jgi:hypothetical protein